MARITVIDDSPEFLELMDEIVSSLGHQMMGLTAIRTSFEEVVQTRPDLMVVDLRLKNADEEVSGWELLVLARSHRKLLNVPVILITADLRELEQRASDLERIAGVHVRTKPFELDEICDLIQRLLDAGRERRSSAAAL